ncbi:MFS transporter [Bacillus xiamenensis]|uniref:MFS transporter n=1 Tax=Bacillus xiamenensis TaxID=1178537 RepID=A0AAC9IFT1_9BACI|nr:MULTISPECIES: MFS transporter [Bacillus]AOZ87768.1 MFS transporter [Bacillus xiamenensis]MBG9912972.1 MFS transporter [Bacillus xiamenensis]MCY9577275.1 MFS transporter [Bacillus xiamenensis]QGX66622.1 MFS transporter [Bacillus sp. ms-22]
MIPASKEETAHLSMVPFMIVLFGLFMITAAVNLQVPLYTAYADQAGYGKAATALVFAAYVFGLIPVLLLLGGISDRAGRKPILLVALCFSLCATLLMIVEPTIQMLFAARLLQGVGLGLSVGTCTAYLIALYPEKSSWIPTFIALCSSVGFGGGALFTAILSFQHVSLTPLSYWVVLVFFILTIVGVFFFVPPVQGDAGKPLMNMPRFPKGTMLANLAIAIAWSVCGLIISILPAQLKLNGYELWVGPALFFINIAGVLMQPFVRKMNSSAALRIGFICLPCGYGLLLFGANGGSILLVLAGTLLAGTACYGFTYLGGLQLIVEQGKKEAARAVAGYYLFAYLGLGIPSVFVGLFADIYGTQTVLTLFFLIVFAACLILSTLGFRQNQT